MRSFSQRTSPGEVSVLDTEGPGRPVVLVHGNSLSAESYNHQLMGDPGKRWRLIAFDLPGHGSSPLPEDPAHTYCIAGYAKVLRELVASLGLEKPVVVGHSLGGHVVLHGIAEGLETSGLLIFGTPPMGDPPDLVRFFHLDAMGDMFFRGRLTIKEISCMAALVMPDGVEPPEYYARAIQATDPSARDTLGASMIGSKLPNEQEILASVGCPAAVVMGERDRIVRLDYVRGVRFPMLWKGSVQVIPGAGHGPQYDDPVAFNRLLREFLDSIPP